MNCSRYDLVAVIAVNLLLKIKFLLYFYPIPLLFTVSQVPLLMKPRTVTMIFFPSTVSHPLPGLLPIRAVLGPMPESCLVTVPVLGESYLQSSFLGFSISGSACLKQSFLKIWLFILARGMFKCQFQNLVSFVFLCYVMQCNKCKFEELTFGNFLLHCMSNDSVISLSIFMKGSY